jgi:hypothetical protein
MPIGRKPRFMAGEWDKPRVSVKSRHDRSFSGFLQGKALLR